MILTDPRFTSPALWAAQNTYVLAQFGPVPIMGRDDEWQDWVTVLLQNPGLMQQSPPRPEDYPDFQAWAERFIQVVKVE